MRWGSYYPRLAVEVAARGVKKRALAESIGVSYRALENRLYGRVPFTWPEVRTIQGRFFTDVPVQELFMTGIDERQDKGDGGRKQVTPAG